MSGSGQSYVDSCALILHFTDESPQVRVRHLNVSVPPVVEPCKTFAQLISQVIVFIYLFG
jgi:hypothetical protein